MRPPVQWTETLRVRNLTTGQILLTQNLPYDASLLGGIEAGASASAACYSLGRRGANANGRIEFTVTTDAASQVFEKQCFRHGGNQQRQSDHRSLGARLGGEWPDQRLPGTDDR